MTEQEQEREGLVADPPGAAEKPEAPEADGLLAGVPPERQAAIVSQINQIKADSDWRLAQIEQDRAAEKQNLTAKLAELDATIKTMERLMPGQAAPQEEPPEEVGDEIYENPRKFHQHLRKEISKSEARIAEMVEKVSKEAEQKSALVAEEKINSRLTAEKQAEQTRQEREFMQAHTQEEVAAVAGFMNTAWNAAWNNGKPLPDGTAPRVLSYEEAFEEAKLLKGYYEDKKSRSKSRNAPSSSPAVNPKKLSAESNKILTPAEALAAAKEKLSREGFKRTG